MSVNTKKSVQWSKAKQKLEAMNFPELTGVGETKASEYHTYHKKQHLLKSYETRLESIGDYWVIAKWNHCPECKKVISKFLTLLDSENNRVYRKWFVKKGESAGSQY